MSSAPTVQQTFIPLSVPEIRGNEWKYVKECLDTGWVSSVGAYVDRFEQDMARTVGSKYAVSVVNGTNALHIAMVVAGVKPGDEVVCSDITFIASANAIRYTGAIPTLIDCEPEYWQLDVHLLRKFLTEECERTNGVLTNRNTGRRVAAIMPVHILGHSVDLDPVLELANEFGLPVIEDAAEGLGTRYKGRRVGSSDSFAACISFNGNKILTTGGGGALVTNNQDVAARAKYLTTQAKCDPIEYIHDEVGYNYRMPNLLAAMGCAQLEQLDDYLAIKKKIASKYHESLGDVPGITVMPHAQWCDPSYWLYTVLVDESTYGEDCRSLMRRLGGQNIQSRPLWEPMHMSKVHGDGYYYGGTVSERLYKTALSIPCSVGLTVEDQARVIKAIRRD